MLSSRLGKKLNQLVDSSRGKTKQIVALSRVMSKIVDADIRQIISSIKLLLAFHYEVVFEESDTCDPQNIF